MQGLRISDTAAAKLPCFMVPYGLNLRFFGRSSELQKLREELDPTEEARQLKAIGIHASAGWASPNWRCNTPTRRWRSTMLLHGFLLIIASRLSRHCLTWQEDWGNIIITTRSQSQASKRTVTTLHLNPFSVEAGAEVLRSFKMSRTLAIRAMACLRAGDAAGALDALRGCWRLQDMDQAQIEASHYPKHSGDVMLLARIYWLQERQGEARELAARSIAMRKSIFGQRACPRVADSLFTVARMLEEGGERVLAAKVLREVVEMCGDAPGMRAHLARAFWFLARFEEQLEGEKEDVEELRARAREARATVEEREWADEDSDEGFLRLVAWMLW
jgi:hypothetical protein